MKERKSKRKLQSYKDEKERNEVIILQRREGKKENLKRNYKPAKHPVSSVLSQVCWEASRAVSDEAFIVNFEKGK